MRLEPACVLQVASAGADAREALRAGRRGRVAALFQRSLYARIEDDWLCVGDASIGRGPINVVCAGPVRARDLRVGTPVVSLCGRMQLGEAVMIDGSRAETWRGRAPPRWSRESLRAGLDALARLHARWPLDDAGLGCFAVSERAAPTPVARRAAPRVAAVADWIAAGAGTGRRRELTQAAAELLGLGPGLTPSGDDLLGGVLVALHKLARAPDAAVLWQAVRVHLATATHAISAAHLRAAARGGCAEVLDAFVDGLIRGDAAGLERGWPALAACGGTSAHDALAGAATALRAVLAGRAPPLAGPA